MPPWDRQFTPQETIRTLNLFAPIGPFLEKARLRTEEEIDTMRGLAALWHWRADIRRREETGGPEEAQQLAVEARRVAAEAAERGDLQELIDGDFPAFGKAYSALSPEEYSEMNSIAVERHHALNWLCGYSDDWDAVPTDS